MEFDESEFIICGDQEPAWAPCEATVWVAVQGSLIKASLELLRTADCGFRRFLWSIFLQLLDRLAGKCGQGIAGRAGGEECHVWRCRAAGEPGEFSEQRL